MAFDECDVSLFDFACAKGFAEFGVGEIVFGDEDDAGGFLVETMDDAGAEDVAALGEGLAAAEERVDERAGVVSSSGVDDHAGGFVDGEDVVVFVESFEWDGFGFGADGRARLGGDGDAFAAADFVGSFGGFSVQKDVGGVDEFLHAGATEVGAMRGDDAVEALVEVVGSGYEVVGHRWKIDSNAERADG